MRTISPERWIPACSLRARGIRTRVVVGANAKLTQQDTDVLVVDTETRHLPAAQAYAAVEGLVQRAKRAGFAYLYKKTDSALRGNVGAELAALLNASGQPPAGIFAGFPPDEPCDEKRCAVH